MDVSSIETPEQLQQLVGGLDPETQNAIFAAFGAYIGVILTIGLVWTIIQIIAWWKIFTKAGEKGWKSIIPIYNQVVLYRISGVTPWLFLAVIILAALSVIPVVGLIFLLAALVISIYQTHMLSKAFGKGVGYTLGLLFLNPIFILILAFSKIKYVKNESKKAE